VALSWRERLSFALEVAQGMEFLHSMKPIIIHRDLKSLNVFVVRGAKGEWKLKVADFGLSRSPETEMMTTQLGTIVTPLLLSIGWLPSCYRANSTPSRWTCTPTASSSGKS
jgi:serine/threonine protein kinase